MKRVSTLFLTLLFVSAISIGCRDQKTPGEKVEDAVEDAGDGIEDAADDVEDAIEDADD